MQLTPDKPFTNMPAWPNLFIVGAMKCGTTSLHQLLSLHPQICMSSEPKEPNYFDLQAPTPAQQSVYLSLFAGKDAAVWRGESSTNYSKLPQVLGVAPRIHQQSPEARIIYIMRDPVVRAVSHYWWQVRWSAEGRPMSEVLRADTEILDVSNYALQLTPYFERFGRDRVYTLTLEELQASPAQELKRLLTWLQVDDAVAPTLQLRKENASQGEVRKVYGSGHLARLKGTWAWHAIKRAMPPEARNRAMALLSRPVKRQLDDADLARSLALLRPPLRRHTKELEDLLGRQFPLWTSLWGDSPSLASSD